MTGRIIRLITRPYGQEKSRSGPSWPYTAFFQKSAEKKGAALPFGQSHPVKKEQAALLLYGGEY
jgi:hypothetical protein